jgi:vancomycin permeability regulator SanA
MGGRRRKRDALPADDLNLSESFPAAKLGKRRHLRRLVGLLTFGAIALWLPRIGFLLTTSGSRNSVANSPIRNVAIVLGAGLRYDGKPSDVLQARVDVGVTLYKSGKVRKLLMSGDNSIRNYDEVSAMKDSAVALGVPENNIILDYAGFRTLDSCVRLRRVFGQTSALVVSQGFHLPRAIHLCRWAGVDVVGVEAPDRRSRSRRMLSGVREVPASFQAWLDAHAVGRSPKFLGEPIDIDNPPPEALRQPLRQ